MHIIAGLVAIAYVPMISGAGITPRWALLSVAIPCMLLWSTPSPQLGLTDASQRPQRAMATATGALFLIYATLSMFWTPVFWDGLDALWKIYLLAMIFILGMSLIDALSIERVYRAFGWGIGLNSGVMILQLLGLIELPGAGLFFNPNFAGEAAALAIVAAVSSRMWTVALVCWPTLILSGSRGALLGLGAAGLIWLWPRNYRAAIACGLIFILIIGGSLQFGKGSASIIERLDLWSDVVQGLSLFGHGVGSFGVIFPKFATHIDTLKVHFEHAHGDILELLFELGLPAVLLLGVFGKQVLCAARQTEFLVLVAFVAIGLVGFPLFEPATAFLAALCAGFVCGGGNRLCSSFDGGRMGLLRTRTRNYGLQCNGVRT